MEKRLDILEAFASDAKERQVRMEVRLDKIEVRLDGIDKRLDKIDTRQDRLEALLRTVDTGLIRLDTRVDAIEHILTTVMATKTDIANAKLTIMLTCIATMTALTGIIFVAMRYVH
ncbi:hypothetical protein OIK44_25040 [Janthinobacterium sp. hw3]|uniref:DUF1640 domain-containing protein n=2 Tax=Janthinobacterium fluminis TaxID=2987524 RepID=A0ABT5K9W7_9BURK|nr:hypothetical protein [Janthinobacterium fluminis]